MLCPTMLRSVVLKCCDRLAGACKCWTNNVGICRVDMLRSFWPGLNAPLARALEWFRVMRPLGAFVLVCLEAQIKSTSISRNSFCVFHKTMYNKTITEFDYCDIRNSQALRKWNQPRPPASADYLDLDYSGYHKNLNQLLFIISWLITIFI